MVLRAKETAVKELNDSISEIETLRTQRGFSTDHYRWLINTLAYLEEIFGRNSRYYVNFKSLSWQFQGSFRAYWDADLELKSRNQQAYLEHLDIAKGILLAAIDRLERVGLAGVYEGKDTAPEASAIVKVINLAEHKLRKIVRKPPDKEREIQDSFENLLIAADMPCSREAEHIEYSSKTYIPDFTMPKLDLAIEIKLCNHDKREKEMIAEVNDDIMAFKTKYGNLLFVVYDTGHIRDVDKFINEFERNENVIVRVIKH